MTILVDARPLVDRNAGGVARVAAGLLPALLDAMPADRFVFLTTGLRAGDAKAETLPRAVPPRRDEHGEMPQRQDPRAKHLRLPNKLLSLACLLGLTSFDRWTHPKPDLLFLPNIGWVGRLKIPYVLVVHDLSFLIEPRWFHFKSRLWHRLIGTKTLIRNAMHLFAVSERTKQDLIERLKIPAEKISVIPMGLTPASEDLPSTIYHLPSLLEGRRFVLCLGAGDPRKNIGCVVAAVEELRRDQKFEDVELVLVGGQHRPSDEKLASLMQRASAFVYPSWYEGFGLPLHEAARFGTPCIASTAGALPETAPQGTLFAPPSKPHLWTAALKMILKNPDAHQTQTSLGDFGAAARLISRGLRAILSVGSEKRAFHT